jgi:hypothetical protein
MPKERGIRVSSTWSRCWSALAGRRTDGLHGRRCRSRYAVAQYDASLDASLDADRDPERHRHHNGTDHDDSEFDRDTSEREADHDSHDQADRRQTPEAAEAPGQAGIASTACGTQARFLGLPGR